MLPLGLVGLVLWLVPGLALIKSKINSGELTDKYLKIVASFYKV